MLICLFQKNLLFSDNIMASGKGTINQPQTGNAKLHRYHFFRYAQDDMDVPDGDIEFGRSYYKDNCAGCHNYIGEAPSLISIFGARSGQQKKFTRYSVKTKSGHQWSKHRLFLMLENPQKIFGLQSAMTVDGIPDPYIRASIIEYIMFMRLTEVDAIKPKFYIRN